jgi:hypothetical protein
MFMENVDVGGFWNKCITLTICNIKRSSNLTSLNLVPNAQVCVYLTMHITKLQLQTTFPKPLYISHSAVFIRTLAAKNLDVFTTCDSWDSNIQLTMVKDRRWQIYPNVYSVSDLDSCWLSCTIFIKYYGPREAQKEKTIPWDISELLIFNKWSKYFNK